MKAIIKKNMIPISVNRGLSLSSFLEIVKDYPPKSDYESIGTNKGVVEIWDIEKMKMVKDLAYDLNLKKSYSTCYIEFSPNGKILAAYFYAKGENTKKNFVVFWPTPSNFWLPVNKQKRLKGFEDTIIMCFEY